MIIDLHNHTTPKSACSDLRPDDLIEAAKASGLDALCLTEHDHVWPEAEWQALRERHGFLLLRGMEVSTDFGHVLAFGLPRYVPGIRRLATLAAEVAKVGGFLILTHPARNYYAFARSLEEYVEQALKYVHTIEVLNGGRGPAENERVGAVARQLDLKGTGASDAHARAEIGRCATVFERPVRDEATLIAELHAGRYRAADLRQEGARPAQGPRDAD